MAAPSPVITEAAVTGGLVKSTLLTALVERTAYVLKDSEVLSDLSQSVGLIYRVVHWQQTGFAYYYNASDTTTPDDGFTCLVDADGHRYLIADGADIDISAVIGLQNAPPGSPVVGDSYIVGTSPTGAWSAHASDLALWTLRGWVFAQPGVGQTVYRKDTDGNTQYNEAGNWVGFAISFGAGSIPNSALASMMGIAVEAQQNAPPGAPTTGQYYLVGTSGSGAWAGHNNDLAYWNGTAWEFYGEYEGATVYNRATDLQVSWSGSAWVGISASSLIEYNTPGSFTWNKPATGVMAKIEVWGAGGSGGRSATQANGANGGGGGAYVVYEVPLASLAASVTVTVGAGGVALTGAGNGNNGGNSSFGTLVVGYGGLGGGGGSAAAGTQGGAGGGTSGVGSAGVGGAPAGGSPSAGVTAGSSAFGGGGGGLSNSAVAGNGGLSVMGGGGGGANGNAASPTSTAIGGTSVYGGGGGGSRGFGSAGGAGGASQFGGAGGAGATSGANATAGAQPGGGGGGSESGNTGKGGDGRVRVTVF